MGAKTVYSIGQFFGKLEIKEIIPSLKSGKHVKLKCLCHYCFNEKIMNGATIKKRNSCGCQQKNSSEWKHRGAKNMPWRLSSGEAARRSLMYQYKRGAIKRDLEYSLSEEKFNELIVGKCFYCGDRFTNIKKGQGKTSGDFIYTGIDRIDSSLGYTESNSVSCCWMCNNMKNNTNIEIFISHIHKIYNNSVRNSIA